jgi:hypothetical protein
MINQLQIMNNHPKNMKAIEPTTSEELNSQKEERRMNERVF